MASTGLNNRKGIDLSLYLGSGGLHDSGGELAMCDSGDRVMRERSGLNGMCWDKVMREKSGLNGMCLGNSAVRGDNCGL